ncbi:MAG: histidine phosphatase family protein [Pseudohongiellaceae bacterium]
MLLHLIRHGQTDWNEERRVQGQSESRLTALGRKQAQELSVALQDHAIERVYCSSSLRARETAELAFTGLALPIDFLESLREIHLGPWEGKLYDEVEVSDPQGFYHFWNAPDLFAVAGAESFAELQQRGLAAIRQIVRGNACSTAAVVSHGALIKALLCHFEGRELCYLWERPHLPNCAHSIVEVTSNGSGRILRYAGSDVHDPA